MPGNKKKLIIVYLFCLLLFLCAIPAVSYAAQQQSKLPEPQAKTVVPCGTTVQTLKFSLIGNLKGMNFKVLKPDGGIRFDGCVETGDLAVITDSRGKTVDCEEIVIKGSESAAASSEVPSSLPTRSEISESGSSASPIDSTNSTVPASSGSSSSSLQNSVYVFTHSVTVNDVCSITNDSNVKDKYHITVTNASGIKKENGYVCTGDTIHVYNNRGEPINTTTAVILGDLTRCGKVSGSGCGMLYNYLTNRCGLDSEVLAAADINQDGTVNTADLLRMKKELTDNS